MAETRAARIVVIDDNESFCEIIELLFSEDCHVRKAPSAEKGLALIAEFRPDLIFCDMMMPGVGGLEFAKKLQADPELSRYPIILCSGTKFSPVERAALEREPNVFAFLPKPCPLDRLHSVAVAAIQSSINADQPHT